MGNGVPHDTEILGSAVGIVVGLLIVVIALWQFPRFRRAVISSPDIALLAFLFLGWVGYRIFSFLLGG